MTTATVEQPASATAVPAKRALEIQKKTSAVVTYANNLVIKDEKGLKVAQEQYDKCGKYIDLIEPEFAKPKNLIYKAYKAMNDLYNKAVTPATEARKQIGQKIVAYKQKVEREAREAQAAAQAEADKKTAAVAKGLETKAKKAEETGDVVTAERLRESAVTVEVAPKVVETDPAPVVATRKTWYASVDDLKALCREVWEGRAPIEAVEASMPFLNRLAVQRKEAGCTFAGVTFKQKEALL